MTTYADPADAAARPVSRLCRSAVDATGVTACGVSLMTAGHDTVTAFATSDLADQVEDLQRTLGEGPGLDAADSHAAVLVSDLEDITNKALVRWPAFVTESFASGLRAVFAFPLLLGSSSIGALSLYRDRTGTLLPDQVGDAWASSSAIVQALLAEEQVPAADGGAPLAAYPITVHQAAGMAMMQLDVPVDQALVRMRATAYAEGTTVDVLAREIVGRRRRLSKEDS